ncbi:MAG: hypothetical protein PWP42_19 [Candidatus Atribacteria bacterium]|uniref:AzlD domain-containing protein n=1 Tax=Atrimonas thermophila TaxID=3064161 RepID=UPI0024AC3C2B|nr:hypothetical protein [Candidatus Atribacteria bacterium]
MTKEYLVIGVVALGTYLLRLLPVLFLKDREIPFVSGKVLDYVVTALLSALLVITFLELPVIFDRVLISLVALSGVYLSYYKWRNIGFSVLVGVMVHFLLSNLLVFH